MGTYTPRGKILRNYYTPYINDLNNKDKLPIIFFDACLTAKLDFTLEDLINYKAYRFLRILTLHPDIYNEMKLTCFAWYFLQYKDGGAIATIGSTRTAYGGVTSGAGKVSIEFFGAYKNSEFLGQMMTEAQNNYITDVPDDAFTLEEFILLGDPTLKIGGYSPDITPPQVNIINPMKGYFHIFGRKICLIPLPFNFMVDAASLGGFRQNYVQITANDETDSNEELDIKIYINDEQVGNANWQYEKNYYDWKWTGIGWNTYKLKVTAKDKSGNIGSDEIDVWYLCLLP